jgi:hypothetical protein
MPSEGAKVFRASVQQSLSVLEQQLTDVLRNIVQYQYPPEVFAISFEIFSDSFTSQFPARAFFMDRKNCEYFIYKEGKATYPSPVEPDLLQVNGIYPEELEEAITDLDPSLDLWEISTDEFVSWFSGCWERAGGLIFPLAATIAQHDSSQEFNLVLKQWQPSYTAFNL